MAKWSRQKVSADDINNGNEYEQKDRVSRQQLNAIVNNSFYAQETADSAKGVADDAKSRVDIAVSSSENAVTTANEAKTQSTMALTQSQEAKTTAGVADKKSDTAISNSQTALDNSQDAVDTAGRAESKADTAVTTSSAANTKATNAETIAGQANTKSDNAVTTANNADKTATEAKATAEQANTTANDASATASAAVDTANKAETTANQANTTAQEAKTAADDAVATATSANNTASDANDKSDVAVDTANSAKTTAEGIDGKATQALTNSETAIDTADDAKKLAEQAVAGVGTKVTDGGVFQSEWDASVKADKEEIPRPLWLADSVILTDAGIDATYTINKTNIAPLVASGYTIIASDKIMFQTDKALYLGLVTAVNTTTVSAKPKFDAGSYEALEEVVNNTTPIINPNGGFVAGKNSRATYGGVAIGSTANVGRGVAIGASAKADGEGAAVGDHTNAGSGGGAVGGYAESTGGAAVGAYARSGNGGAVGQWTIAGIGFSGGYYAQVKNTATSGTPQYIDAIQLGTGTNEIEKSLQVYDDNLYDALNHKLGAALLDAIYPIGAIYIAINPADPKSLFGGEWEPIASNVTLPLGDSAAVISTGEPFKFANGENIARTTNVFQNASQTFYGTSENAGSTTPLQFGNSGLKTDLSTSTNALRVWIWQRTS